MASPSLLREPQRQSSNSMLVYDEVLQQHRRLLSKLDLEERRRKEAREGGERHRDLPFMSRVVDCFIKNGS